MRPTHRTAVATAFASGGPAEMAVRARSEPATAGSIAAGNSPPLGLPLGFFLAGPLAFVAINALLVFDGGNLLTYYLLPVDLSLTHLVTLGWVTMVMMGALYQLTPVIFQTRLHSARLGRWQFGFYLIGVAGLVTSFRWLWAPGLAIFGSAVVLAVALFLYNMARTLWRPPAWTVVGWYLAHSLSYLGMTVISGLTFALDLRFHWFPIPQHVLAAHVDLGLIGWFTLTLMGVGYQLVPMFGLVHGHSLRLARWILRALNLGILLLFISLLLEWPRPVALLSVGMTGLGVAAYAFDVYRMFRRRRRRVLDLTQWHTILSTLCLLAAMLAVVRIASGNLGGLSAQTHWYLGTAYLALAGWVSFAIMGQYYKILPFLIWNHRYAAQAGREPVPLLRDLYSGARARVAFLLYLAGFVGVATSLLLGASLLVRLSALLTLGGSLGFAWTLVEVLRPRSIRVAPARSPPRPSDP